MQAGDKSAARAEISSYRTRNYALNEQLDNREVWDNLAELDALETDLEQQFQGQDQASRQNIWAKTLNSFGYSNRRQGQSRSY